MQTNAVFEIFLISKEIFNYLTFLIVIDVKDSGLTLNIIGFGLRDCDWEDYFVNSSNYLNVFFPRDPKSLFSLLLCSLNFVLSWRIHCFILVT